MAGILRSAVQMLRRGSILPSATTVSTRPPGVPAHALTLTAAEGFGYFPAHEGQIIGNERYKILRMIGVGNASSVFLAEDLRPAHQQRRFVAIKILSSRSVEETNAGHLHELATLQALQALPQLPPFRLPRLFDHFEIAGPHGNHVCLVLEYLGHSISAFRRSTPTKRLRLHVVQLVAMYVADGLRILHENRLIHTDVHPGNTLSTAWHNRIPDDPVIERTLRIAGEMYACLVVPQPAEVLWGWDDGQREVEDYEVKLCDLGTAKWADEPLDYNRIYTPYALRAPELILRAGYDAKIDIWAIGCVTFELLTGSWCFDPEQKEGISLDAHHLALIAALTGDTFPSAMLERAQRRDEFFTPQGTLRVAANHLSIEQAIARHNVLDAADISVAADFIRICLRLDPEKRPTARDLIRHDFTLGAGFGHNYRPLGYPVGIHADGVGH